MSDDSEIIIPTNVVMDGAVLATALPLAVFTLGLCLYILIFPDTAPHQPGMPPSAHDIAPVTVFLAAMTVWLCARGFGALWRALDRRPMLVADRNGLTFHPALCREAVAWRDVRRLYQAGWQSPYTLAFDLKRRIWAVEAPWTARRVRIGALYLGDSMASMGWVSPDLIARLEGLRAGADPGSKASRDTNAGD